MVYWLTIRDLWRRSSGTEGAKESNMNWLLNTQRRTNSPLTLLCWWRWRHVLPPSSFVNCTEKSLVLLFIIFCAHVPSKMLLRSRLCSSMCWGQFTDLGSHMHVTCMLHTMSNAFHMTLLWMPMYLVHSLPVLSDTTPHICSSRLVLCSMGRDLKEWTVCIIWDGCIDGCIIVS